MSRRRRRTAVRGGRVRLAARRRIHNWAVFEPTDAERPDVEELDVEEIEPGDDELGVALGMLGVRLV